jgi:hypothetical protein
MTLPEDLVAEQRDLLASWRSLLQTTFAIYHALDPALRPPELMVGITKARSMIAQVKARLRAAGVAVDDQPDEVTAADPATVNHNLRLLSVHRRNLSLLFQQRHLHGPGTPPAQVVHQVEATQRQVAEIKRRLREWQISVDDLPEDDSPVG